MFVLLFASLVSATLDCDLCKPLATIVEGLIRLNVSESFVAREIENFVCPAIASEIDPAVCSMAVQTYAPTVYPILVAGEITALGLCQLIGACEDEVSLEDRRLLAEHRMQRKPFRSSSSSSSSNERGAFTVRGSTFRIMQVSDVHFDSMYVPGSNANCNAPMCCRSGVGNATTWGDYKCDLTQPMLDAFFAAVQMIPDVDAIIWTGDMTPHDVWNETRIEQLTRLESLARQIEANINLPVFLTLGNHDTYPCDQFSTHPIDADHLDDFRWLLDGLTGSWPMPNSSKTIFKKYGFYSAVVTPGLKLIAVNSAWWDNLNFYLWFKDDLGAPMIAFLDAELGASERSGEKVIIAGHIPIFGAVEERPSSVLARYIALCARYNRTIVAQLFGHTHHDEYQLLSSNSVPYGMQYVAPSLTTFTNVNPSYRVYEFDAASFEVLDYVQYRSVLSQTIASNQAQFDVAYSAKQLYGLADLSVRSWKGLIDRMAANDTLFGQFYSNKYTGFQSKFTPKEKKDTLCRCRGTTPGEIDDCANN